MTKSRRVNIEAERRKRELRQRLARARRRIDADAHAIGRDALERLVWRAQVRRHPLAALGVAAGIGVGLSLLPSAGRLAQSAGRGLLARVTSYAVLRAIVRGMRQWRRTASETRPREDNE